MMRTCLTTLIGAENLPKEIPFTVVAASEGSRQVGTAQGVQINLSSVMSDKGGAQRSDNEVLALDMLEQATPTLSSYFKMIKDGVPDAGLRRRLTRDVAAGVVTAADAARFEALACPSAPSSFYAAPPCKNAAEAGANDTTMHLKGTLAELHGKLGDAAWEPPHIVVHCDTAARAGYNTAKSHECLDTPAVLQAKVKLLAALLRAARAPVFYAGAGLSTMSGVGDYATQTGQSGVVAQRRRAAGLEGSGGAKAARSRLCASPNHGHRAVAALARAGYVWRFVQQNHDGLPQKAGMPQHCLNEIHGAWFDPSNPVVAMRGGLRSDLFADLRECEERADLVIALGSSLCGMNADRLVSTAAACMERKPPRATAAPKHKATASADKTETLPSCNEIAGIAVAPALPGASLGSVIVSLQQTAHDKSCALRIFGLLDDVLGLLAVELGVDVPDGNTPSAVFGPDRSTDSAACAEGRSSGTVTGEAAEEDVFLVPYDEEGKRLPAGATPRVLDLREGAKLRIATGPYHGAHAVSLGKNREGHYRIAIERHATKGSWRFTETRLLGKWWPYEAVGGCLPYFPVVANPESVQPP
jgi:hypothetical protein